MLLTPKEASFLKKAFVATEPLANTEPIVDTTYSSPYETIEPRNDFNDSVSPQDGISLPTGTLPAGKDPDAGAGMMHSEDCLPETGCEYYSCCDVSGCECNNEKFTIIDISECDSGFSISINSSGNQSDMVLSSEDSWGYKKASVTSEKIEQDGTYIAAYNIGNIHSLDEDAIIPKGSEFTVMDVKHDSTGTTFVEILGENQYGAFAYGEIILDKDDDFEHARVAAIKVAASTIAGQWNGEFGPFIQGVEESDGEPVVNTDFVPEEIPEPPQEPEKNIADQENPYNKKLVPNPNYDLELEKYREDYKIWEAGKQRIEQANELGKGTPEVNLIKLHIESILQDGGHEISQYICPESEGVIFFDKLMNSHSKSYLDRGRGGRNAYERDELFSAYNSNIELDYPNGVIYKGILYNLLPITPYSGRTNKPPRYDS